MAINQDEVKIKDLIRLIFLKILSFKWLFILPAIILILFIISLKIVKLYPDHSNNFIYYINIYFNYVQVHPYRIFGCSVLFALFVYNLLIIYRYSNLIQLVKVSGLVSYKVVSAHAIKKEDIRINDYIRHEGHNLSIWGITGNSTFSTKESPLYDYFCGKQRRKMGNIRVLLIDPESEKFKKLSKPAIIEKHKENFQNTLSFLKKIKGLKIEVRQYRFEPSWKMIIFDNCLWLQYYDALAEEDEDDTEKTGIEKAIKKNIIYFLMPSNINNDGYSLYKMATQEFERVWEKSKKIALEDFAEKVDKNKSESNNSGITNNYNGPTTNNTTIAPINIREMHANEADIGNKIKKELPKEDTDED